MRRARTPTILQMEEAECGAAALAMVLAHHGRHVPLEELRERCGVSRDGVRASHLLDAAEGYGLAAEAFRAEPEALRALPVPAILHWGMTHFVVLEGAGRRGAWLNDPAWGPRFATAAELDRHMTGVVLTFRRGPAFRPGGTAPSVLGGVRRRLAGNLGALGFAVAMSLLLTVPGLLLAGFSQVFVDDVLGDGHRRWLPALLGAMAGAALLAGLLTWLQLQVLLRLETRLAATGAAMLLHRMLRLPLAFFARRHPVAVAGRIGLNDRVARLAAGDLGRGLLGLVTAAAYLAAMLAIDAPLAALVVLLSLLNLVVLAWLARGLRDGSRRVVNASLRAEGMARGGLAMLETWRAAGQEAELLARIGGLRARVANQQQALGLRQAALAAVPGTVAILAGAAVLVMGGARLMDGSMSLGELTAFQVLMAGFMAPVAQLVAVGAQIEDAAAHLATLEDTLDQPPDPAFLPRPATARPERRQKLQGRIELRGVTYGHNRLAPPLIRDLSLVVEPGGRLGIVGASGSGKSTLAMLIAGLHRPWSGEVLLDGAPIGDIPRELLRNSLAVVDQRGHLFEGTVRDTLSLWDPTLADERLVECARDAVIHAEILNRPGGYGAPVAEDGRNFSGGQRVRLDIARALATDPRILVLDEATAALDNATEAALLANLRRRGCTMVLIAHRLTVVEDCAEVLVLDHGTVVQRGRPAELAAAEGPYRRLLDAG